jgi:phosphate transport system permease protein
VVLVTEPDADVDLVIEIETRRSAADRAYRAVVRAAGASTLVLMIAIGFFLTIRAVPAFRHAGWSFFTETAWSPTPTGGRFGVAALLLGTALIAAVSMVLAVPIAIGTALFITELSPSWLRRPLTSLIDLLAAIPSLVYGIWGATVLQGRVVHVSKFLHDHFGWLPPFRVDTVEIEGVQAAPTLGDYAASTFLAGIVVALMVLPLATAVMREVFSQTPPGEKEGALALGGTRWGVITHVVLPFGRGGIVGGSMLGLGRALGETVAVALIINPRTDVHDLLQILRSAGNSIAALIANGWAEGLEGMTLNAMMAAGLVLFAVTLVVNAFASVVVARSRSGGATEI